MSIFLCSQENAEKWWNENSSMLIVPTMILLLLVNDNKLKL